MLVVPNESEIRLLEYMLNVTQPTNQVLHLFRNDITIDGDTVIGDLQAVTAAGYSPITLVAENWTIDTDEDGVAVAEYPRQEFTFNAGEQVYGYYVTNLAKNILLWAQRADFAPANIPSNGGFFAVTPVFSGRSVNDDI